MAGRPQPKLWKLFVAGMLIGLTCGVLFVAALHIGFTRLDRAPEQIEETR